MKYTLYKVFTLIFMTLIMVCCRNPENPVNPDTPVKPVPVEQVPTGTLMMHLHNYLDGSEIDDYNIAYTNLEGRRISFAKAQFYLSNFELVRLDGSKYVVPDSVVLKLQEISTYTIAHVPVGNYKTINFNVGIDSEKLNPNVKSKILLRRDMVNDFASANAKPIDVNLQGSIDTSAVPQKSKAPLIPFKILLNGTNSFRKVSMPVQNDYIIVTPGNQYFLHMYADLNKIFEGINVGRAENLNVVSGGNANLAAENIILSNIEKMFRYE